MGVECGYRDARFCNAGRAESVVSEFDCGGNALRRDHRDRFPQCHMGSHAKGGELLDHIHLAEKALMLGERGEHLMLIVIFPTAAMQRGFVERRKTDAIEFTCEREIDHMFERLTGELA